MVDLLEVEVEVEVEIEVRKEVESQIEVEREERQPQSLVRVNSRWIPLQIWVPLFVMRKN